MIMRNLRNIIPDFRKLAHEFSDAAQSAAMTLHSPRRLSVVAAFAVTGALGGAGLSHVLGTSLRENQIGIRGISAAQYDREQVQGTVLSAVFYGGAGVPFGFMGAGLISPQRRQRNREENMQGNAAPVPMPQAAQPAPLPRAA